MKKLYIAVVAQPNPLVSGRAEGDLSCFISDNKDNVIRKAVTAAQKWSGVHRVNEFSEARHHVEYRVLVGELSQEARMPVELIDLGEL